MKLGHFIILLGTLSLFLSVPSFAGSKDSVSEFHLLMCEMALNNNGSSLKPVKTVDALELSIEAFKNYYKTVDSIGTYINDKMKSAGVDFDEESIDVNPFYHQISANGGIELHFYYGFPSFFATPLGQVNLHSSSIMHPGVDIKKLTAKITEKLGLVEISPKVYKEGALGGVYGPVFAVTKDLQGKPLPMPVTSAAALSYDDATKIWDSVNPNRGQSSSDNQ